MSKAFSKLFKKNMFFNEISTPSTSFPSAPLPDHLNPFSSTYTAPPSKVGDAPPPAYTTAAPSTPLLLASVSGPIISNHSRMSDIVHKDNDKYAFLAEIDTVFLIDDSGSMAGNLWREAATALSQITEVCTKRDRDGVDLYFFNHDSRRSDAGKASGGYYNLTTKAQVDHIFRNVSPGGGTFTGLRLDHILKPYLAKLQRAATTEETVKPINLIVITDGAPTDDPEDAIVHYAESLDKLGALRWQCGIQFFQVGNDPEATRTLNEMDDDLKRNHGCRDMVDTAKKARGDKRPLTSDEILKVVLGAVQSKVDRKEIVDGKLV